MVLYKPDFDFNDCEWSSGQATPSILACRVGYIISVLQLRFLALVAVHSLTSDTAIEKEGSIASQTKCKKRRGG